MPRSSVSDRRLAGRTLAKLHYYEYSRTNYPLTPVSGTNNSQYCLHRYYVAQYAQGTVGMGVPHVCVEKKWFVIAFFQPQATSEVMILTGP